MTAMEWQPGDGKPPAAPAYCCAMREKFLVGLIGIDDSKPTPADEVDFIDFDAKLPEGDKRPVLRIKFCPFCGQTIKGPLRIV